MFNNIPKTLKFRYLTAAFVLGLLFLWFSWRSYELVFANPIPDSHAIKINSIRRGTIFDSQGHELAITEDRLTLGIRPASIKNIHNTSIELAKISGLSVKNIESKINKNKGRKSFFYVARKIRISDIDSLRHIKIPGVVIEKEQARKYPNNFLASSVLGFVGLDNEGLSGIEYQWNDELSQSANNGYHGNNVHLTINSIVQKKLTDILREEFIESKSRYATAIISEVATGKIIAMASLPDYDPNHWSNFAERNKRNYAISAMYEPGSTFKMFTLASLLKNNMLDEKKIYYCPGYFEYKGARQVCPHAHGRSNIHRVMRLSCNTGVISASWDLPILHFYQNLRTFGFGRKTNIELPGELKGRLRSPAKWDVYLKMSIPIGHGIGVTPIQMTMAANSLANGGRLLRPIIIEKVTTPEGEPVYTSTIKQINSTIVNRKGVKLRSILAETVGPGGTGFRANPKISNLTVCGKTGTSIKFLHGKYQKGKYTATFLGFVPCEKPIVSILILFDEPQGSRKAGGNLAAPTFSRVVKETLPFLTRSETVAVNRLEELPFNHGKYARNVMPNLLGKSKKETTLVLLKHYPGKHYLAGSGYVLWQQPLPGAKVSKPFSFRIKFGFPR